MAVTCYESDREVRSHVHDEGRVLTVGEITDRLNRLAILEHLFGGCQAKCDKLEKAIRQLAHDHPDTVVSWPSDGVTHYREVRDWAAHVLDEEPRTSCPHCGRRLDANTIGKMPLHTPPSRMTICPGVGKEPVKTAESFDPAKNPHECVVNTRSRSSVVLGPADLNEGACYGRDEICVCLGPEHAGRASLIAALLNASLDKIDTWCFGSSMQTVMQRGKQLCAGCRRPLNRDDSSLCTRCAARFF